MSNIRCHESVETRKGIHSLNYKDSDIVILISDQHSILTNKQTLIAQLVKNPPAGDPSSIPGSGKSSGERIGYPLQYPWASLVAQLVKNPPVMQEVWV